MPRSDTTAVAAIVVAVLLAYFNALGAAFQFDDFNVIVDNPAVHSVGAWAASMPGIRPLLKLSYALNWSLRPAPFGFHFFNVAVHAVNAVLVFRLLRALSPANGRDSWAPLIGALLFALHPVQTEAVTYVSGRSVSLMALFYLSALLAWLRADRDGTATWRAGSAVLFGVALLVKETAITLPLALLLLDARSAAGGLRERLLRLRWHFAVLAFALGVMAASPTYRQLLDASLTARGLIDNLLTQANAVCYLAAQLVPPWRVNIDPDLPVITGMSPGVLLECAGLLALAVFALRRVRKRSWMAFAILWFLVHLLPTNSILPRLDVANDRQLYLAAIGVFFCFGLGVDWLRRPDRTRLAAGIAAAMLLVVAAATVQRNEAYASAIALWEDALEKSPRKARVANNLGFAYQQAGRYAEAKLAYRQAIESDPGYWKARINLESLESAELR